MEKVGVNEFVRRQIKGSGKSYAINLTFEQIAEHAKSQMAAGKFRKGYREGIRIVVCAPELNTSFVCPFTKIDENTELVAHIVRRQPAEEPYIQIRAINCKPQPTGKVELVLYSHDVLAENNEQSTHAEWELISIHALPQGVENMPMGPVSMMRNQLELTGGTRAQYTADEWAESIRFWQRYAAVEI